jgi:AcrR family transcriptional regulator
MAAVAGERGYLQTHVSDVLERSGASRRTFYRYFSNREECFLAAYDAIVADLTGLLGEPATADCGGLEGMWKGALRDRLDAIMRHFAAWPAHARLLVIEASCAGPPGIERHERTLAQLAQRLAACPAWLPEHCAQLERGDMAQVALGAVLRLVRMRLVAGDNEALIALTPILTELLTRTALSRTVPA